MGLLGDATGDHFYIIEEGEYKLTQSALYVINGFIRSLVWGVHGVHGPSSSVLTPHV